MLLQAGVKWCVSPHDQGRHGLGDLVAYGVGAPQHPGGVTHRGPGLDGGEGDDLGGVVPAVLLRRVADHLVPPAVVEVHVDVGHGDSSGIEEAFEEEVVADGVDIGDGEAVGHRAPGGRTPSGSHPDPHLAGVADQVPHDQEVGAEAHVGDDLQLIGQAFGDVGPEVGSPPLVGPLERQVPEVLVGPGESLRNREVG